MAKTPIVDDAYRAQIQTASKRIEQLLESDKSLVPLFLKLAFHDGMTFDKGSQTGGANGSVTTDRELNQHTANKGLAPAADALQKLKGEQCPQMTIADLIHLAGILAIRAVGGPFIAFTPGRRHSKVSPPEGRLPALKSGSVEDLMQLQKAFARMGLPTQQWVALCGVHYLSRWWMGPEEESAVFQENQYKGGDWRFGNRYFKDLLAGVHPVDAVLLQDAEVKQAVELFATDSRALFRQYAAAHEAVTRLGTSLPDPPGARSQQSPAANGQAFTNTEVVIGAVVLAGAAAVLGLAWYNRRRKLLRVKA